MFCLLADLLWSVHVTVFCSRWICEVCGTAHRLSDWYSNCLRLWWNTGCLSPLSGACCRWCVDTTVHLCILLIANNFVVDVLVVLAIPVTVELYFLPAHQYGKSKRTLEAYPCVPCLLRVPSSTNTRPLLLLLLAFCAVQQLWIHTHTQVFLVEFCIVWRIWRFMYFYWKYKEPPTVCKLSVIICIADIIYDT